MRSYNFIYAISGLNKLPTYNQGVLYRGVGWWEKVITADSFAKNYLSYFNQLKEETNLTFPFMSTTKDAQTIFVQCTPLLFKIIKSKNGVDISNISIKPEEKEILFKPYATFTIKRKYTQALIGKDSCKKTLEFDQQLVVELEETNP